MRLIPFALTVALAAAPAIAQMDHGGGHGAGHGAAPMDHGATMGGVTADATLNAVSDGVVNVSHGPIPEIGWPAMTMDLPLLHGADTGGAQPGDTVVLTLEKGADGMYGVKALAPK